MILDHLPESQRRYFQHWMILAGIAEGILLIFNRQLTICYLIIATLFLIGFLLRVTKLYPGEEEPLVLDFSAVVIALGYALTAKWMGNSAWRFLLIFCSSGILIPHFIFIQREK